MASKVPSASHLLAETRAFVKNYMSQPRFDASHDYSHVLRVLAMSKHILSVERAAHPSINYDDTIIELCALLHDVADHKYTTTLSSPSAPNPTMPPASSSLSNSLPPPPSNPIPPPPSTTSPREAPSPSPSYTTPTPTPPNPPTTPLSILLSLSCPPLLAQTVQEITTAISYRTETRSPALVQATLRKHPELAIVQDADRLDALGAVGIGRAFTFGGAGGARGGDRGMRATIDHFEEKLEKLPGLMKTDEGRRMARERGRRVKVFRGWWEEEEQEAGG